MWQIERRETERILDRCICWCNFTRKIQTGQRKHVWKWAKPLAWLNHKFTNGDGTKRTRRPKKEASKVNRYSLKKCGKLRWIIIKCRLKTKSNNSKLQIHQPDMLTKHLVARRAKSALLHLCKLTARPSSQLWTQSHRNPPSQANQ